MKHRSLALKNSISECNYKEDNVKKLFNDKGTIYGFRSSSSRSNKGYNINDLSPYPQFDPETKVNKRNVEKSMSLVDMFSKGEINKTELKDELFNNKVNTRSTEINSLIEKVDKSHKDYTKLKQIIMKIPNSPNEIERIVKAPQGPNQLKESEYSSEVKVKKRRVFSPYNSYKSDKVMLQSNKSNNSRSKITSPSPSITKSYKKNINQINILSPSKKYKENTKLSLIELSISKDIARKDLLNAKNMISLAADYYYFSSKNKLSMNNSGFNKTSLNLTLNKLPLNEREPTKRLINYLSASAN